MLPRQGACPLGAHLVTQGGHSFCVDVYEYPGGNTIPRTNVSFSEAGRICAARGERLCTDGEWERACRGKGGASYPYGQAYEPARCNTDGRARLDGLVRRVQVGRWRVRHERQRRRMGRLRRAKGRHAPRKAPKNRAAPRSPAARPTLGGPLVGFRCCADPTGKH